MRLLSTSPLNETDQTWGVALMKAQANLADTLPGENVTFLLYGGATVDNVTPSMEAVVMSTGLGAPACAAAPSAAVLLQSPHGSQVNMTINGAGVTFGSTLYITAVRNGELTIATIEGLARVEAFNVIQTVSPGAQVRLPLGSSSGLDVTGPPSPPEPFDLNRIQTAPLGLLPDAVQIPPPISAGPTATPTLPGLPITSTLPPVTVVLPPTAVPAACVPRSDWAFTYTIQSGDTLSRIAQRFGLTVAQLQSGNCITDANLINAGQVLRVPVPLPTATALPLPTLTSTNAPTLTPTAADFRADSTTLKPGECTTVRWDVDNIDSVFFEGEAATGHSSQQVCPKQTTRYTLLVIHPNGDQLPYFLSIEVLSDSTGQGPVS